MQEALEEDNNDCSNFSIGAPLEAGAFWVAEPIKILRLSRSAIRRRKLSSCSDPK